MRRSGKFETLHLCGSEASKRELPGSESQNENCCTLKEFPMTNSAVGRHPKDEQHHAVVDNIH